MGRYALYGEIAAGGMATVHFGRLLGPVGFSRTVAIKRLHPQFAKDPEFVSMFLDEARLAARIRHPNVVPTLDVVATQGELFLVMDYVQGESLSRLIRAMRNQNTVIPPRLVSAIMCGALHGLHAAHEAKNERGEPLRIVHRDISPQNILVGVDGVARVLDFGVAKASGRMQTTREGQLKGKLSYMAPEQIGGTVSRQTDVYAAAIVLWEALTGQRLISGDNEGQVLAKVLSGNFAPPSQYAALPPGLDQIVLRGLAREPVDRWATARDLAVALERCVGVASPTEVGEWVEAVAHITLSQRAEKIAEIESSSTSNVYSADALHVPTQITEPPPISQASQLSSISVSKSELPQQRRPQRTWLIAVAVGLLASIVTVVVVTSLRSDKTAAPISSDSAKPLPAETQSAPQPSAQPTLAQEATPPVTATATPAVTATATATAAVTNRIRRPPPPPTTVATPPPPPPPATTTATKNCDPPYTLDDKGHKLWKRECM